MRSAADIGRRNTFDVIRASRAAGGVGVSRRDIAESIDLSFATVAKICAQLLKSGILTEVALDRRAPGRPTTRLSLNPDHGMLLGVDIAETYVHVEAFDCHLDRVSSTRREIDETRRSPTHVVQSTRRAISDELEKLGDDVRVLGVGVSAPGQVDQVGGTSVFAPNWDWHNVPLLDMLKDVVDAPLWLDNPLKSLAIAELWSNSARRSQDFVVLNLGTGVGAGIAIQGTLLRGRTNSAGEWGHIALVADGRSCRCGARGCVEAYVGARGIMQTLRERHPSSGLLHGDDQTLTIRALAAGVRDGDPEAIDTIDATGRYLGIAMASIVNLLNPDVIVIGGWVAAEIGEELLAASRRHMTAQALATPAVAALLELQRPQGNSVSLGAAAFALEGYVDSLSDLSRDPSSLRDHQTA